MTNAIEPTKVAETAGDRRRSDWWGAILRPIVTLAAIGAVLWSVDVGAAFTQILQQDHRLVGLAIVITLLQVVISAVRWRLILAGLDARLPLSAAFRIFYIGSFFSAYVWSNLSGDVMRSWLVFKTGVPLSDAVNSVILDRVVVLASVAVLTVLATPWFFARWGTDMALWLPAVFTFVLVFGVVTASQLYRLPERWRHRLLIRYLHSLGVATLDIFTRPAVAIPAILCAMLAQTAAAGAAYAIARSLALDVSLIDCIVLMQIVAILVAVPISIGGWGVREVAVAGLFGLIGVGPSSALLLSVQLGLVGLIVNLPGGIFWVLLHDHARPVTGR